MGLRKFWSAGKKITKNHRGRELTDDELKAIEEKADKPRNGSSNLAELIDYCDGLDHGGDEVLTWMCANGASWLECWERHGSRTDG